MKKKKLKLNKDTLLVLESRSLQAVAAGIAAPKKTNPDICTPPCITNMCPTQQCPATSNCSVGCPTTPQPLP